MVQDEPPIKFQNALLSLYEEQARSESGGWLSKTDKKWQGGVGKRGQSGEGGDSTTYFFHGNKSSPRFVDGFNEPHVFIREDEIKDLHMFKGMLCCYLLLITAKILFVSMSIKPIWKDKNHQLDSNQNMKKSHVWVAIHSLTDKYNV